MDVTKMNLQQIVKVKNEMAADLFAEALQKEKFPCELISEVWKNVSKIGLDKGSPTSARVSQLEFARVINADQDNLTMFEFGVTSNLMEDVTFRESGLTQFGYKQLAEECAKHISYYQARINAIRENIQKDVEAKFALEVASKPDAKLVKNPLAKA